MEYCKYTTATETLEVKCRHDYIDFNGLADYSTLHGAIREISPNHIICWHGGAQQRGFLMQRLAEDRRYDVKGAGDGESIEITSDHTVTIMRLTSARKTSIPSAALSAALFSSEEYAAHTKKPLLRNSRAISLPIPRVPPVTSTFFISYLPRSFSEDIPERPKSLPARSRPPTFRPHRR